MNFHTRFNARPSCLRAGAIALSLIAGATFSLPASARVSITDLGNGVYVTGSMYVESTYTPDLSTEWLNLKAYARRQAAIEENKAKARKICSAPGWSVWGSGSTMESINAGFRSGVTKLRFSCIKQGAVKPATPK